MFKKIIFLIITVLFLNNTGVFADPSVVSIYDTTSAYDSDGKIPKYEKFEITFTIDSTYSNPYNYDTLTGGVKIDAYFTHQQSGNTDTVAAFWFQEYTRSKDAYNKEVLNSTGSPCWKVRYAPDTSGDYSYLLKLSDSTGDYVLSFPPLTNTDFSVTDLTSNKGFIRINPKNSRFFAYDNGDDFFGIGLNVRGWTAISKKTYFFEEFFGKMQQNNANFARVWMVNSTWRFTDWVVTIQQDTANLGGNYDLADAWRMDNILKSAKNNGIYLQLTLEDSMEFINNWPDSLYNTTNGGPCAKRAEIFTNADAKKAWKRLLRYLVARYGYSPNILSWELWNEINELLSKTEYLEGENWNTITWPNIKNWHSEMAQEIGNFDVNKHLITTSTGSFKTFFDLYALPGLDYGQIHGYYVKNDPWSYSPPDIFKLISYYSNDLRKSVQYKPNVFGEFGALGANYAENLDAFYSGVSYDSYANPSPSLAGVFDTTGIHLHNGLWTGVMEGLAATPLSWTWEQHLIYPEWWKHYKTIGNFLKGEKISDSTFVLVNSTEDNLIKTNSGFETLDSTGWVREWAKNPASSTKFSIDSTEYHGGTKSLKWENNISEGNELSRNDVSLMPDQEYTLSGWIKTENVTALDGIAIGVYFNDGTIPSGGLFITKKTGYYKGTTNGWIPFVLNFTSPVYVLGGYNYTSIIFIRYNFSTGKVWIDDLKLTPSGKYASPSSNSSNLRILARKNDSTALMWIQNKNHTWYNMGVLGNSVIPETALVTVPNVSNTNYSIEWWDAYSTAAAAYRKQKTVVYGYSTLNLTLPAPLAADIAVKIKPLLDTACSAILDLGYVTSGVDPESGPVNSNFTFRVKYTDTAGYFPKYVNLILDKDGTPVTADEVFSMDELNSAYNDIANGKTYTKTVNIPYTKYYDSISYKFEASDGISSISGSRIFKPYLNLDLSMEVADPTEINLNQLQLSSLSRLNGIVLINKGRRASFTLKVNNAGGWSAGETPGKNIYVLKALFTGADGSRPGDDYFKANDIVNAEKKKATAEVFGDPSFPKNGGNAGVEDSTKVWFLFNAPKATSSQNEENISITIGVEDP